ncbi:PTS sugar transporter subunit IIB [Enterococcus faecium]|uniref:PTS system mannose/fructose/N-acetylgalactosamine-transporter subunit IIB n=1 Tax=Enterococcus faecium TaxID=1352 RepID=UPI001E441C40|nr:PTS sugar transporter subunit IIB [Enterococcus faecium]MCD5115333.1 PTS sugar transporter subunit IIB [Enterococcus faecium]MCD5217999.1 PTS sugar transporter subunit IIB [Enterococcus faecium]
MEMKGINNIRIDDRLIHGQVATMWSNKLGVTRLMVVNDEVSNNDIQKQVLRMAVPAGISSSIISTDTAVKNIKAGKYEGQNVLLIVKSPVDLLPFLDNQLLIKSVNVGNMSSRKNTIVLRPNISVTEEEREAFEKLLNLGIEITTIMTPDDKKTYLKDIL